MFDGKRFWQLHSAYRSAYGFARQFSAAKGLMGACPHMRLFYPD